MVSFLRSIKAVVAVLLAYALLAKTDAYGSLYFLNCPSTALASSFGCKVASASRSAVTTSWYIGSPIAPGSLVRSSTAMFFTDAGRCYWLKVHEIPEAGRAARGKAIVNLISIVQGENIASFQDLIPEYSNVNNTNIMPAPFQPTQSYSKSLLENRMPQ